MIIIYWRTPRGVLASVSAKGGCWGSPKCNVWLSASLLAGGTARFSQLLPGPGQQQTPEQKKESDPQQFGAIISLGFFSSFRAFWSHSSTKYDPQLQRHVDLPEHHIFKHRGENVQWIEGLQLGDDHHRGDTGEQNCKNILRLIMLLRGRGLRVGFGWSMCFNFNIDLSSL